ncbi:VanZ family protein [Liquorilactobacillus mali]|uniref:Glycopeptide antibiotics resistance protein n=1 Tax=Liquorilactobacillus mali KCTC 3596 = DSM 20444 TaxID=1046596 RepID=J1F2N1_9LACO|nr:VanZ family protein [Liquorilactobacillus mali]EJE99307.1 glycopeptide antibiotics resistance protein [Liquorilactobacillus mali KCTC 3596 = DSM 20444]KRN10441.1 glycopeptide antibiotics resistance protein [Liquorilactobacillus mali KCTC 3596 = DSM 20444]MDC7952645.1 VanZ family protein [Liquorilactobacillus mali]MDN7145891.1 VanZ family protein [Liquorilactobacillus mali]MDV7758608.1 VanZ family protein [Liquorilactobacillus mali]
MLIDNQFYLPVMTITPFKLGFVLLLCAFTYWSHTSFPKLNKRNILKGSFLLYLICVAQLTISINIYKPQTYVGLIRSVNGFGYFDSIEWHPLEMYKTIYTSASQYTIVGNMVMLIPLTIFISLLWEDKATFKKMLVISFLTSLTIESSQLLLSYVYLEHRLFDINDLLQNTLGGVIGFLIFLALRKMVPSLVSRRKVVTEA